MTDFDISALEKALSSKSRKPRQDPTLKPELSKQELYDEAKRLAEKCNDFLSRSNLRTRHQGASYSIDSYYGTLRRDGNRVKDIEQVPKEVFEKLVANGKRLLKDYYDMIKTVTIQNPEIALEANLEGKTSDKLLGFIYDRKVAQLAQLFEKRVSSPEAHIRLGFNITMNHPSLLQFRVTVAWEYRRLSFDGIDRYTKKSAEMAKLVHFLTCFEQVTDEVNRQLNTVEIRKEVKM